MPVGYRLDIDAVRRILYQEYEDTFDEDGNEIYDTEWIEEILLEIEDGEYKVEYIKGEGYKVTTNKGKEFVIK